MNAILGNRVHFAPLAGVADAAVRVVARLFGAGPSMSEMVSAHGVVAGRPSLIEKQLLLVDYERPLSLQLVGSNPGMMADAAAMAVEMGADSINLNMACPARKIVKGGKGCAMMRNPQKSEAVMRAVRDRVKEPVTVKIRAGWDDNSINAVEFSKLAQDCGMEALFLHPRTRAQAFSGKADWSLIERTVRAVTIPVIGNGDIKAPDDALRMIETTGCAAVMIGRGALGRPWLFSQVLTELARRGIWAADDDQPAPALPAGLAVPDVAKLAAGDRPALAQLIRLQLDLAMRIKPEYVVVREIRKHLVWYSRGQSDASAFRSTVHLADDLESLDLLIADFFDSPRQ
jgi:tRNA-dihydrouridine synthase B